MKPNLNKTIEQIEGQVWGEPDHDSHLVLTCHVLRKKPIKDFTIEDLRMLIGQGMNLDLLIPLAIERLKRNILSEGDNYPADLLDSITRSDPNYWKAHKYQWTIVCNLYEQNRALFESDNIFKQTRKRFEGFSQIFHA